MVRKKTALVTAVGSFAADVVIRNLKREGYAVAGCDIYPAEWVAQSLDVDRFYQAPYANEEEAYISFLCDICRREGISYLIPLTDVEVDVLSSRREELEAAGVILCVSGRETVRLARDKFRLTEFLRRQGLCRTIPTWFLTRDGKGCFEESADKDGLTFPVVIKPYNGRSSQGLRRIYSEREFLLVKNSLERQEELIVQPLIDGRVVTVDMVRCPEQETAVCLPRRELLRTLNGAGTSVCVFRSPSLEGQCVEIAKALDIRGCVNFEWIETAKGEYYFLECNPRFSGGVAFSCMAGYDMVANHVRCFSGETVEPGCGASELYIARKYMEVVTGPGLGSNLGQEGSPGI